MHVKHQKGSTSGHFLGCCKWKTGEMLVRVATGAVGEPGYYNWERLLDFAAEFTRCVGGGTRWARMRISRFAGRNVSISWPGGFSRPSGTDRLLLGHVTQDWVRQKAPNHPGLNSPPSRSGLKRPPRLRELSTIGGEPSFVASRVRLESLTYDSPSSLWDSGGRRPVRDSRKRRRTAR